MASTANIMKTTHGVEAADEVTPLLGAAESGTAHGEYGHAAPPKANDKAPGHGTMPAEESTDTEDAKMPYVQILLLCYGAVAEPIAYFAIFPFVNQMIKDSGDIPEKDVGFWSGAIESLFSLVQMFLMIFYGRLSNRLGRKPILVFSLAGVSVMTALFGLSKDLWHMIMFRCLAGVFAGSVVTTRTMLSENTNKKTQGRAFSWYMFARNAGIFIGPLIGGGLAQPAQQFPGTFGNVQFFIDYPYALSTFVAGAVCLSGTLVSLFGLKETLVRKQAGSDEPIQMKSTWEVLKSPNVPMVLYIYGHVIALALAYTAISPVFQFTSIENGGFSFSPQQISIFLAIGGGSQALWMLFVFAPVQRRYGTGTVLRATSLVWPLFMVMYPILNEFLRAGYTKAFWFVAPPLVVLGSGVSMAFACIQLCVNDIAPSPTDLGTLNAIALAVSSGIRAVMPTLGTSLFAIGIKWGWADGHLVWVILTAAGIALIFACFHLPEEAEGRPEGYQKKSKAHGDASEEDGVEQ